VNPLNGTVPLRIGVFGGAFDPPHIGHLALARTALNQLQLDALRIIPTGQAWHKTRELSAAQDRLNMARLAFAGLDRVVVDPREVVRSGPSYTVDTLRELHREFPGAQLFLIVGQDQALALRSWYQSEEIPRLAIICVAVRAGFAHDSVHFDALPSPSQGFRLLEMPPVALSATDIRRAVANHQDVAPLVFEPVARYIEDHHLYRTAR
jgi:nicotinate-nucleotide adenylyltransferase